MPDIVCSPEMKRYFDQLQKEVDECYKIARAAREKGYDPELKEEIPQADDLASRVEKLLNIKGIAGRIRQLSKKHNREEVSILIAKEMAAKRTGSKEEAVDKAIRVGLAVLTEGILVAPLEGVANVKIMSNSDGTNYVAVYYAGPIRSAGGTGQAMSVLIADVVRRELGIGRYKPTRGEIERLKEEIPLYKQSTHLQYTPTSAEIETIISNCPVCIDGEGTDDVEITGYRDLPRIETNRVRGGACLVIAEGLCQKAPKLQKHVQKLKIDGWDFLDGFITDDSSDKQCGKNSGFRLTPNEKFIKDIVAGRPVLSHPSRKGGFRLRYGRSRATGLAAVALHPATMYALEEFIAVGTQIKIERPGKAGAVTPCDQLEGPIVLLKNGDLVQIKSAEEAKRVSGEVKKIMDLGEILISYGEFAENNHILVPGAYCPEWWRLEARAKDVPDDVIGNIDGITAEEAFGLSMEYGIPLYPGFNLFWNDVGAAGLMRLREHLMEKGEFENSGTGILRVAKDVDVKHVLIDLGALHTEDGEHYVLERYALPLMKMLGLESGPDGRIKEVSSFNPDEDDIDTLSGMEYVSRLSGISVRDGAPTRIGARMARPEKAKERKMKPPPHILFPVGLEGGPQRLMNEALTKNEIAVDVSIRVCKECGKRGFLPRCTCGGHTKLRDRPVQQAIDLEEVVRLAMKNIGEARLPQIKGVQGMISKHKTPEPVEKGILRAKHGVFVFKDGTTRFDMTDVPVTHFTPREIGLSVEKAGELGYQKDVNGRELERDDQLLELKVQDFIASKSCGEYLVRVAGFIDDMLERMYGQERFYNAEIPGDLIGHLVVGLAPHTSGGVLARLIGYTKASVGYAHPYFHAAKRRNCDGDEDCVMLLLDGLLNFSRSFLPEKRGGLMDAPLVLTTRLNPDEIDKEAHNIDLVWEYPLEFYDATLRYSHPKKVEHLMDTVSRRIGTVLQYEGMGYTHGTSDISEGPRESVYKTLETMIDKMNAQLSLARKIRAVDEHDVVARVISKHFLPDMIGNLKKFSSQKLRCTKCGKKYRRVPLAGTCRCGRKLTMTVHEKSVKKYLDITKEISSEYNVSNYIQQRVAIIEHSIDSLFKNDKVQECKLEDFF